MRAKCLRLLPQLLLVGSLLCSPLNLLAERYPVLQEPPRYGVYFSKREPAFYTGFAPRVDRPEAIHLHVGRGNQLRVTLIVSRAMQRGYAQELLERLVSYRAHIRTGTITPSQNQGFRSFERVLASIYLDKLVEDEELLAPAQIAERNWNLLQKLNPGRAFDIQIPLADLAANWKQELSHYEQSDKSQSATLQLINDVFPTRLHVTEITPGLRSALSKTIKAAKRADDRRGYQSSFARLFAATTKGLYPVIDGIVTAREFTAIYPIGTWNSFVDLKGRKIPAAATPGRRALTTHQRTKTVDHIPTKAAYSYFPWIPYMHVGPKLHNSFHTLWWQAKLSDFPFLPDSWRDAAPEATGSLFLLSRGPMSHGCTHVNAGHILELRQMLPAQEADMFKVDTFLNRSYDFDVFDIDGDLQPEVMGVAYFIAYSLKDKKPYRLRAPNKREAYYDWLYGGELKYRADGSAYFAAPRAGAFSGRQATAGKLYHNLSLYEAKYQSEKLQFFKLKPIPFIRELRQVSRY